MVRLMMTIATSTLPANSRCCFIRCFVFGTVGSLVVYELGDGRNPVDDCDSENGDEGHQQRGKNFLAH